MSWNDARVNTLWNVESLPIMYVAFLRLINCALGTAIEILMLWTPMYSGANHDGTNCNTTYPFTKHPGNYPLDCIINRSTSCIFFVLHSQWILQK